MLSTSYFDRPMVFHAIALCYFLCDATVFCPISTPPRAPTQLALIQFRSRCVVPPPCYKNTDNTPHEHYVVGLTVEASVASLHLHHRFSLLPPENTRSLSLDAPLVGPESMHDLF